MKRFLFLLVTLYSFLQLNAQNTGIYSGIILDKQLQKPVQGAVVKLVQLDKSVVTDSAGRFQFTQIKSGYYTFIFSALGYTTQSKFNVTIASGNENTMVIELESSIQELASVTVNSTNRNKSAKAATLETPLSVQRLTSEEIKANPGGNFDISRVIQALPGVGGSSRSAGGPTGILNVSFIEEVKLSSSAFDARFDNTLSSVFEFKQKRGNSNRVQGNIRLSGTELATTFDGPIGKSGKTTFLASARRSYLQLLFKAIDLPIRPNYWDFQYKISHQLSKKTTLTLLGVGAIDEFNFAAPREATPEKLYVLNSNPSIQQWNYTIGASIKHQLNNGYWNLALSRNAFNNQLEKYENNLGPIRGNKTLALNSSEVENKLRFDVNQNFSGFKLSYGLVAQLVSFSNNTNQLISNAIVDNNNNIIQPSVSNSFNSNIQFARMVAFTQLGKRFLDNKLGLSAGIRFDQNTFTKTGMNPLKTLSPRIAASYVITDKVTFNASVGTYFKMLPYTALGYRNNNNELVNKNTDYTQSTHYVAGFEYLPSTSTRFTIEGYYKQYSNVPISVRNGISLSNQGADFNVLGNEAVSTTGKGKAYGFEFFAQQKLTNRFYGVLSYTWFVSKYTNANNSYAPSSWDNRHLLSAVLGYKLKRNWEIGLKFRYQGGVPYTPFDLIASRQNYLTLGTGIPDYNNINTQRLNAFNSSDIRIDKKWFYKRFTLNLFLDITNWYLAKSPAQASYTFQRNATNTGFLTTDGQPIQTNGSNAIPFLLSNNDANVTPTIGFIIEF